MQDLSQAVVKLSCVTDDTCGSVHNTLRSVSNRPLLYTSFDVQLDDDSCTGRGTAATQAGLTSAAGGLTRPGLSNITNLRFQSQHKHEA